MRKMILFVALMVATSVGRAHAQAWDSRGWVLLGEREVNGKSDHDRIEVGAVQGSFSKVTMVVQNSDLELVDFKITFADKTNYHPKLTYFFKEGARTRVIDLPPAEPVIRAFDFQYRNVPGGGRAKVQVWGWQTGPGQPQVLPVVTPPPGPLPPLRPVTWNNAGWVKLGERTVDRHFDHDRIEVARAEGKFTKLTLVVDDSDLELIDMSVKFGKGPEWHPSLTHFFKEGQRTREIDFPGDERVIKYIDFKYRNLPGGGRAKIAVWAKPDNTPTPAPAWDSRGWQLLGERVVNGHGKEDKDHIEVGRKEGLFGKLMLVVLDSDLEIIDFQIKFKKGAPYHPEVKAFFKEGSRTRAIDLPGNNQRIVKWLDFTYRNLPGGGRAKIQVWGK